MTIAGTRERTLLLMLGSVLALLGLHVWVRAGTLPYGSFAPVAAVLAFALALIPFTLFVRKERLAKRLVTGGSLKCSSDQVPVRPGHTYLGEGFVWGPAQTRHLNELSASGLELPQDLKDRVGGDWTIHGIGADRMGSLFLPNDLLNQHVFLMGAPGSGKTRGLELLIEQAVARGDAVVVIDPKGDEGLLDQAHESARRHGRAKDFRVLALPYPYQSARYNPLGDYVSPSDIADRVASILPKRGDSEPFRNFAWQFVSTVAAGLDRLGEEISLAKLENYCIHNTWLLARRLIRKLCPEVTQVQDLQGLLDAYREYCLEHGKTFPEVDALIDMASLDREYFGKISGSLRTILSKLTSRSIGYLLCPRDVEAPKGVTREGEAPVLSWRSIDNDRLVVYFFLGSLIGQDSAAATARMALSDLMSFLGKKYAYEEASGFSRNRLTVVVDEVADALAPESVNILNKARGAGLSMVMAGQSLADLEVALGSAADARRALANVGTFLTLRAANPDDARYFTEKVGVRPLPVVSVGERYEPALFSSGRNNISDFSYQSSKTTSSRNDPLLPNSALDRLARFHFFGLWGGELYKGILPFLHRPSVPYSARFKNPVAVANTGVEEIAA